MITPRIVRRALLRACPLAVGLFFLSFAAGTPPSGAIATALLGTTPAALLPLQAWARGWEDPTTAPSQVALALLGWVLGTGVLLFLLTQAVYAQALLSGQDPLASMARRFGEHDGGFLLWTCGFLAVPLAASNCVLVSGDHDPKLRDWGPIVGLATLIGVWAVLLVAPLASPEARPYRDLMLMLAIGSGICLVVGTLVVSTMCVYCDVLEEGLWPREATP